MIIPKLVALAALASTASAGQLHVVDSNNGPGTDFTSLQAAIDSAADGDVLLLRTGFYSHGGFPPGSSMMIDGKGLMLMEESGASAVLDRITILNLAPTQYVTLRGFEFFDGASISLLDCAGPVWIEDCSLSFNLNGSSSAITGLNASRVHLNRCAVTCTQWVGQPNVARLTFTESNVSIYDCSIMGCDTNPFAPDAMSAVAMNGGTLFVSGSELLGGAGCGGRGLILAGAAPTAEILDSDVLAGFCTSPTPDIDNQTGTVIALPNDARSFDATSPVRSGGTLTMNFAGNPDDFIFLDVSLAPGEFVWRVATGIWQLAPTGYLATHLVGSVPASGTVTIQLTMGSFPGPLEFYVQADMFDTGGGLTLSGGSSILFLP